MDDSAVSYMQKHELRSLLLARGITVADYKVEQLRELAYKAIQMKLPVISTPDDTVQSLKRRTTVKVDNTEIHFPFISDSNLKNWSDNLSSIPDIQSAEILAYLISNMGWSGDRIKQYKQERGYRLYQCRHISRVVCHPLSHAHLYVRGSCTRETSQSEKPYLVWSLLKSDGSIVSAGCECTGDDGGCKHVVALLFSLMDWGARHTDRHTETCTDVQATWDNPRRVSQPKKLDEISLSEKGRVHPFTTNYNPSTIDLNNNTLSDLEQAVFDLVKDCDTQIMEVLDKDCDLPVEPPTMLYLASQFKAQNNENISFRNFVTQNVTENDCKEINGLTEGQHDSVHWYIYRTGRITALSVHKVVKYTGNDMNNYILKEIFNENPVLSTAAVLYGRERESLASELFQVRNKEEHNGLNIIVPGLIVSSKFPYIAASPDGIVSCKCCGKGLIEIKCPYKYRYCTISELASKNYHVVVNASGQVTLKLTSPWYYQIQCQLAVTGLQFCFLVLYLEGSGPCKHQICVERIEFDRNFWETCLKAVDVFFDRYVVPKLLSN